MNFGFTKVKVIVSLVIPILLMITVFIIGNLNVLIETSRYPKFFISYLQLYNSSNILALGNITLLITQFIVIFVIWSIFQKRV